MWVLGINAPPLGWHDPTACLVNADGAVQAVVEEERLSRIKHAPHAFPVRAARACLDLAGIQPADVDVVALGWDLPRHAGRQDLDALDPPVPGRPWEYDDAPAFVRQCLGWDVDWRSCPEVAFVPHHLAHAASSFHASGFQDAAVLVMDGNGDDEAISVYDAEAGRPLVRRERWPLPYSLGYLYGSVSEVLGLSFLEAGKTMGLAAYGRAAGLRPEPLLEFDGDALHPPFALPTNAGWEDILAAWTGHLQQIGLQPEPCDPDALSEHPPAVRLAWSAQHTVEQAVTLLAARARELTGRSALCLAGGVALNCSANGQLDPPVYVPPVPHDAGVALGAAWTLAPPRAPSGPLPAYLGRPLSQEEAARSLARAGLRSDPFSAGVVAARLLAGQIGGVVTGRAEIGPRALCNRSIIATATSEVVRDRLNRIKGREWWRPLSPVGLSETAGVYWGQAGVLHRYMLGASPVTDLARAELPGIVHVDGTARPQILAQEGHVVAEVLQELRRRGEAPALINTSFNARGEPIVDTVADALRSARTIGLDFLLVDDRLVALGGG